MEHSPKNEKIIISGIYPNLQVLKNINAREEFSDLMLILEDVHTGKQINMRVHRIILAQNSDFFYRLLISNFNEKNNNTIKVRISHVDVAQNIILMLYSNAQPMDHGIDPSTICSEDSYNELIEYILEYSKYDELFKYFLMHRPILGTNDVPRVDNLTNFLSYLVRNQNKIKIAFNKLNAPQPITFNQDNKNNESTDGYIELLQKDFFRKYIRLQLFLEIYDCQDEKKPEDESIYFLKYMKYISKLLKNNDPDIIKIITDVFYGCEDVFVVTEKHIYVSLWDDCMETVEYMPNNYLSETNKIICAELSTKINTCDLNYSTPKLLIRIDNGIEQTIKIIDLINFTEAGNGTIYMTNQNVSNQASNKFCKQIESISCEENIYYFNHNNFFIHPKHFDHAKKNCDYCFEISFEEKKVTPFITKNLMYRIINDIVNVQNIAKEWGFQ